MHVFKLSLTHIIFLITKCSALLFSVPLKQKIYMCIRTCRRRKREEKSDKEEMGYDDVTKQQWQQSPGAGLRHPHVPPSQSMFLASKHTWAEMDFSALISPGKSPCFISCAKCWSCALSQWVNSSLLRLMACLEHKGRLLLMRSSHVCAQPHTGLLQAPQLSNLESLKQIRKALLQTIRDNL